MSARSQGIMTDGRIHRSMDPGLYIAASGMLAEQVQQNQLANNLSNANTPGFEPQEGVQQSFGSLLLANTANGQPVGALNPGAAVNRVVTENVATPLQQTGQPLDFGIAGDGYFAVQTAGGVR